ncbi:hypothetical protein IMZ48_29025 [Candidatus Bathyarchaeota archaeon]|nr:hypothetical protein [Candidatus Bathyarchaeota archaeon]
MAINGEPCLLQRGDVLILIYVNDYAIAAPTQAEIDTTREQLREACDLKNIGTIEGYLGFEIVRDRANRKLWLHQRKYVNSILERFGYENVSPVGTPAPSNFTQPYPLPDLNATEEVTKLYQQQCGSVNWLAGGSRPDIAFVISKLSEANHAPSKEHIKLIKNLFRYLKGTAGYGILYQGDPRDLLPAYDLLSPGVLNYGLHAASDAAHADNASRVSTGGYVVFVGRGPVMWKSKKQPFVALSTAEAEFINLTPTGQALL